MTVWVLFFTMWVNHKSFTKEVTYSTLSECMAVQMYAAELLEAKAPGISYSSICVTTFRT